MKRIITAFLSLALILSCGTDVYAEEDFETPEEDIIIDEYIYTYSISNSLSITNNTASCISIVVGHSNVTTKIRIEQTLQKKNGSSWSDKVIFTNIYNSNVAIYSTQKSGLASGTYRLKTVAKVYSGDNYETVTKYSSTCTC